MPFFPAPGEDWCLQAWEFGQRSAGITACEEHRAVNAEAAAGHSQLLSVLLCGSRHSSVLWFSIPFHQGSDVWKHLLAEQFLSHTIWILLIRLSCSPQSHFCIFHSYQASCRKQHWCYMDSLYYNCVANKNAKVPQNNAIWGGIKEIPSRSVKEFIYYRGGDRKAGALLSHLE